MHHTWRRRGRARTGGETRLEEKPVEIEPGGGTSKARARATSAGAAKKRAHAVARQRRAMVVVRWGRQARRGLSAAWAAR
jgi:hypothetical protein